MEKDFRDKFAIVGLGMVTGRLPGITTRAMAAEATRRAIEDAGLKREDIDGTIYSREGSGRGERSYPADHFPRVLGLPAKFHFVIERGSSPAMCITSATKYLELGVAKYVAIARGKNDWSRSHRGEERDAGARGLLMRTREGYWGTPFGELRAVSFHIFLASRHMYEYGTTSRQFGAIAVAERQWALKNPLAAMYGRPMTIEDHQNSPILVYPYHLLDMCLNTDGAIAFILTTAERAKDCAKRPVYIMGVGFGEHIEKLWWEKANYTRLPVDTAKEQAFSQAGIELKDIDVAQLYDCFTAEVLLQIEDYGWCKKGEGGSFAEEGHIGPGGDIPVNTGGGLLSAYHYGAFTPFSEAVIQLRGEGGERQVKDVEICLASAHGNEVLSPGMSSLHHTLILRR